MKNSSIYFRTLLVVTFFMITSCNRETPPLPIINIVSPSSEDRFNIKDEISYSFEVSGEEDITCVIVSLCNSENVPIQRIASFFPNRDHSVISSSFEIKDTTLSSGRYFFKVMAQDKNYTVNKAVPIYINEIPATSLGILAITESSFGQTHIYQIDTAQHISLWATYHSDFFDCRLDNKYQQLYLFPKTYGQMRAVDITTKQTVWSIPSHISGNIQFFRGVELINHKLYVGDFSSYVKIYDHNMNRGEIFTLPYNYMGTHFLKTDFHNLIFQIPLNAGSHRRIVGYNLGHLIPLDIIFNYDLKGWFVKSEDEVFLFYNTAEGFDISILTISSSGINRLTSVLGVTVNNVVCFEEDQYLISSDKGVYSFSVSQNSVTQIIERENMKDLTINKETKKIAVASGDELLIFVLPHGEIIHTFRLSHEIRKIFWHFTK